MTIRLRGPPSLENREIATAYVPEDKYDYQSDETTRVEYDRTYMFPITRWIQMNRGETITHEKLHEFQKLSTKAMCDFISGREDDMGIEIWDETVGKVRDGILHLWDVEGSLKPWLAEDMCKIVVGTSEGDEIPESSHGAHRREMDFRGGPNSVEMALANLGDAAMGIDADHKSFSDEEISKGDDPIEYNFDLEQYFM